MPWIAVLCLLVVGACRFEADYTGGRLLCEDDICPSDLQCREINGEKLCLEMRKDAAVDMPVDTMIDGNDMMPPALNCAQPGALLATGDAANGTTVGRTNKVAPLCNGSNMVAPDAIYRIMPAAGKQMTVAISTSSGTYQVAAYVTTACPPTSGCVSNMYATPGNPIVVTTIAGPQFIVVDSTLAAAMGDYTLNVSVSP